MEPRYRAVYFIPASGCQSYFGGFQKKSQFIGARRKISGLYRAPAKIG